jgi:hypothetical protein
LPSLSKLEGSLGSELKQLQSAASMQSLEKTALKEVSQNAEVKSLLKEETQVKDLEGQLAKAKDAKGAEVLAEIIQFTNWCFFILSSSFFKEVLFQSIFWLQSSVGIIVSEILNPQEGTAIYYLKK